MKKKLKRGRLKGEKTEINFRKPIKNLKTVSEMIKKKQGGALKLTFIILIKSKKCLRSFRNL